MCAGGLLVGGGVGEPAVSRSVVAADLAGGAKEAVVMAEKIKITGTASAKEYADLDYRVELAIDLSLRDLFAAFALAGLAVGSGNDAQRAGEAAYRYADAALNAREGTK